MQWPTMGRKKGRGKCEKLNASKIKRAFLGEIKSSFCNWQASTACQIWKKQRIYPLENKYLVVFRNFDWCKLAKKLLLEKLHFAKAALHKPFTV